MHLFHDYNYTNLVDFLNDEARQKALHVPNPPVNFLEKNYDVRIASEGGCRVLDCFALGHTAPAVPQVFFAMTSDQMISMKPRYAALLDEAGLDVMIYHGNLDPCFTTAGEEAWLR